MLKQKKSILIFSLFSAALLLSGCSGNGNTRVYGSVGVGFGNYYYDPYPGWGGGYRPPNRPDRPVKPVHPIARPPSIQPIGRPSIQPAARGGGGGGRSRR